MNLLEVAKHGFEEFIAFLAASGLDLKEKCFVSFDGTSYIENPSNSLKILVDHHKEINVVVNGLLSFSTRSKFKDSLVGRKKIFKIYLLDFGEFFGFKDRKDLTGFLNTDD